MRRRRFLIDTARAAAAVTVAGPAVQALLDFEQALAADDPAGYVQEGHWRTLGEGRVQCLVCPLHCRLDKGETCFCRTRQNVRGKLVNHSYGRPCIVRTDPIEKTPLNHFRPGGKALSIATGGCNLRCLYCQNWRESQTRPKDLKYVDMPPLRVAEGAVEQKLETLCFTYTDPVAFSEYVRDISTFALERGVKSIVATGSFIEVEPIRELCKTVAGWAMALKGFDDDFYVKVCGQKMSAVLRAIETVREEGAWLELTTLVIPTLNDDTKKIAKMCKWVRRNLGADVPLHFARFVPEYRLKHLPRTPVSTLEDCRKVAQDAGLEYVYLSNVAPHEGNRTDCPGCGTTLIDRVGFRMLQDDLDRGRCRKCKRRVPGIWS